MAICAGNRESGRVCTKLPHRFVLTAFQQCHASVYKNKIALSCFAGLQPGHRHDCNTPIVHHMKLRDVLSRAQMLQSDWCRTFFCGSLQRFWLWMLPGPLPLVKGGRGPGTRLAVYKLLWWFMIAKVQNSWFFGHIYTYIYLHIYIRTEY